MRAAATWDKPKVKMNEWMNGGMVGLDDEWNGWMIDWINEWMMRVTASCTTCSNREFLIVRERRHVMPCLSSAPSSTGYCERHHQSVDDVKSVGLEFKICTLTSERSGTTDCRDQWAERRHVTSCLSSAPSSTGYCQRRHRSVNNVKPVTFEFKIWVVNMLSIRWDRGACAVALMLRADIRQFSIVRRLVNEDIMRSSPCVAGRHSLDYVD